MINIKRLTVLAVVFLVVARIAVGWQFFYEGLWKYQTVGTANEWSAAGYLKNARGPFRDQFRGLMEDPDDLNWLNHKWVSERWKAWQEEFVTFHGLTDEQKQQLNEKMDGPKEIIGRGRFRELPKGIKIGGSLAKAVQFKQIEETDKNDRKIKRWRLVVNREWRFTPREKTILVRLANSAESRAGKDAATAKKSGDAAAEKAANRQADLAAAFRRAVNDVYQQNANLGFRERLAALLKGDGERVTIPDPKQKGTIDYNPPAKTSRYIARLNRYNEMLSGARTDFQHEHLAREATEIRKLHAELVDPVKQLERDMQKAATGLLTDVQREKGEVPIAPTTTIDRVNWATMWGLMVIGMMLIVGFFSRLSALAGGLLVLSFYLVMPPWPGVPPMPGPEHSLFINKNAIEVLALFALVFIPTGKYFGIDALFIGLWDGRATQTANRPSRKTSKPSQDSSPEPKSEARQTAGSPETQTSSAVYSVRNPK